MRTAAEKKAFAKECLEIEQRGGNVQEYIALNWPSYTPRATWYNLQRQYLGRSTNDLTEGKPQLNSHGKEVKPMKGKRDKNAVLEAVLKVLEDHGDPVAWFEQHGYAAPLTSWQDLKKWTRAHRPDEMEKLPKNLWTYYAQNGIKRQSKEGAAPKASETPTIPKEAVESVFFGGKEYEKMDNPSPTCCQPTRPSGVTVPDSKLTEPEKKPTRSDGLRISAVESWHGKYELCGDRKTPNFTGMAYQQDFLGTTHEILFSPENWLKFAEEIPIALEQLGLLSK